MASTETVVVYGRWPHAWGEFTLAAGASGLVYLGLPHAPAAEAAHWVAARLPSARLVGGRRHDLAPYGEQLDAYLDGVRREFTLPLHMVGSAFERAVWQWLLTIPYGRTRAYRDGAMALGRPRAVRAVAQAVARNPMAIVVPCHRVVGRRGGLVGYAGGLALKARLLALEGCRFDRCGRVVGEDEVGE